MARSGEPAGKGQGSGILAGAQALMGCVAGARIWGGWKAVSRWDRCPAEGRRWVGPDPVQPCG